jgi:hypothetical protein
MIRKEKRVESMAKFRQEGVKEPNMSDTRKGPALRRTDLKFGRQEAEDGTRVTIKVY